jgi:hypothetical protein
MTSPLLANLLYLCISSLPGFTMCLTHIWTEGSNGSNLTGEHLTFVPRRSLHCLNSSCSECTITHIRKNLRLFGSASPPLVRAGRLRSRTPMMLDARCDHLTSGHLQPRRIYLITTTCVKYLQDTAWHPRTHMQNTVTSPENRLYPHLLPFSSIVRCLSKSASGKNTYR